MDRRGDHGRTRPRQEFVFFFLSESEKAQAVLGSWLTTNYICFEAGRIGDEVQLKLARITPLHGNLSLLRVFLSNRPSSTVIGGGCKRYADLFAAAGLAVRATREQKPWPKHHTPVQMWALRPFAAGERPPEKKSAHSAFT